MDTQKKPVNKKTLLLVIVGTVIVTCICLIAIVVAAPKISNKPQDSTQAVDSQAQITNAPASDNTNTPGPTNTPAQTSTPKPTNTPKPTSTQTATPDPNLVKAGTYLIGTDIKPGIYKGQEADCYWERLKDVSGNFDAIIANENTKGQFYIEVKETDGALNVSCDITLLDPLPEPPGEYPKQLQAGTYLIGTDIKPGIYKGQEADCYWSRLKNVAGEMDSILANENTNGQFYIEVKEGDGALLTSCAVNLLDPLPNPPAEYPQTIQPGTYLVGTDIQPGTYKGEAEGCYWARLRDVTGGFQSIIANDNTKGQFYVQVSTSDTALSTSCELVRTGE